MKLKVTSERRHFRVEYVSDVILTHQDDSPTELAPEHPTGDPHEGSTTTTTSMTAGTAAHKEPMAGENPPRAEARAWLSYSTGSPSDVDDDLDVLAPEAEESSSSK
ncbi:hypothetical protein ANCCAN_22294 [Ancylostoma caninum]|uniref:Uncharacterized protein n=1 Tax=Ancylostoma caninum TaxID=29170 RepID=A0A368FM40_ANCCA|nr:hypothetical protein ANCCAN_22294 [Ancylostoma caninum]